LSARAVNSIGNVLLLAIGFDGGRALSETRLQTVLPALAVTVALVFVLPVSSWIAARGVSGMGLEDRAALATLYGSVSSAIFVAAYARVQEAGIPSDGFVTALGGLLELGLVVAIFIGKLALRRHASPFARASPMPGALGIGAALLSAGLFLGWLVGDRDLGPTAHWARASVFLVLLLFVADMGMVVANEKHQLRKLTPAVIAYAVATPVVNALIVIALVSPAGLRPGSVLVLAAVGASASFINGPALVRQYFPGARPAVYLTAALGVTFPFLMLLGLPLLQWLVAGAR
jgi:hypothetical protein